MRRTRRIPNFGTASLIEGQEVTTGKKFEAISPATALPIAIVDRASGAEIDAAVAAARKAAPHWGRLPIRTRQLFLARLLDELVRAREPLARLIAVEQGKPIAEARAVDLIPVADTLRYLSRETAELLAPRAIRYQQILFSHKSASFRFDPLGVIGIITPWNFPLAIPFVEVAAAIAAGNTVVLKPASATALVGIAIGELCRRAGLPPGVVNVVTAGGGDVSRLVEHPDVAKVLFTGSVETGIDVARRAASHLKGLVLELGGKDPSIVCADADLDRAAAGIVWGAFVNAGQACGSIERVYVVREVADQFIEKVIQRTRAIRVGDPLHVTTDMGPMTTAEQRDVVEEQVAAALKQGAKAAVGGKRPRTKGYWYPPTVLLRVNGTMRVMRDETFGPVLPIQVVGSIDEAIHLANDSDFGLTASAWTRSAKIAERMAMELEAGTVTINDHLFSFGEPTATWGGIKKSGIGRSHAVHGLMELVNIKHVSIDLGNAAAMPWWYPYDQSFQTFTRKAFGTLYSNDPRTKVPEALGLMGSGRFFGYVRVSKIARNIGKMF